MSFSNDIKEKIAVHDTSCEFCSMAELSGAVCMAGQFFEDRLVISTESEGAAKRICKLVGECFSYNAVYDRQKGKIIISDPATIDAMAVELELFGSSNLEQFLPFSCCRSSYVRGAFLGGGAVNNPKSGYHLEFDARYQTYAERLVAVLDSIGIASKITKRRERWAVYVKEYETIAQILVTIGADNAALELYMVSVEKEMRNNINRLVNCESANIKKTTKAYTIQNKAILKIEKKLGLNNLPDVLQEMAEVRRNNPEASLKELGELLNPPIGRSGVNHRLNRLIEIAEQL